MPIFKDKISEEDKKKYRKAAFNSVPNATAAFFAKYIAALVALYKKTILPLLDKARALRSPAEIRKMALKINAAEVGFNAALNRLYKSFNRVVYSDKLFEKLGVTNPLAKRTILNNSITQFKDLTQGALSRTNTDLLKNIRDVQTRLLTENARIDKLIDGGKVLKSEKAELLEDFEKRLYKQNKNYKELFEDKRLYVTYRNGAKHDLDEYVEMSVKTTVLNVDRNAVTMQAMITGKRVSEYYKRDNTPYKTNIRREVCAEILSKKFKGRSLVAHDQEAANVFGILTLDEAKARGAFLPNCKHSIKSLPKRDGNRIDSVLFLAEKKVV